MTTWLALVLALAFAAFGLLHAYWAFGGSTGNAAAIPHVDGAPAFRPTKLATLVVAGALIAAALMLAVLGRLLPTPVPASLLAWPSGCLALVLFARGIGDFRLVGLFKRPGDSVFARLDTLVYSPLCFLLAAAIATLIFQAVRGDGPVASLTRMP